MQLEEIITKEKGIEFVEACGDVNPVHRDGDIVQGMQLASLLIKHSGLVPEYQNYKLKHAEIRFRDIAKYNELLFFSSFFKQADNSTLEVTGKGTKQNGKDFIDMKMIYIQNLGTNYVEKIDTEDLIYNKAITSSDIERFCRSINIDYELFRVAYLKEFFVSTFIAGALCMMIDPRKLPGNKKAILAKQEFDFCDFPSYDFKEVNITLKKVKDTEGITKINENCYIDNYNIIKGYSIIFKIEV